MAIEISLNGVNISGNSKLLTNSTIKGGNGDVTIKLEDTTLADGVSVLDSTLIEQPSEPQNQQYERNNNETGPKSFAKGIASFVRDVAVNLVSDGIQGKIK